MSGVIVPYNRPIREFKLVKAATDGRRTRELSSEDELIVEDEEGQYILWRIRDPEAGWSYRLDWDW